jgi:hypothetical protein
MEVEELRGSLPRIVLMKYVGIPCDCTWRWSRIGSLLKELQIQPGLWKA